MLRESRKKGHHNILLAALDTSEPHPKNLSSDDSTFIPFESEELPFSIPGMSDVMPYKSSRFRDLNEQQITAYEDVFLNNLTELIRRTKPDIIHSHHLWVLSSLIKNYFADIPLITSCHGSDLRQFHLCQHLQEKVLKGCRRIEKVLALTDSQKADINNIYTIPASRIDVVGAGYNNKLFNYSKKKQTTSTHILYCGKLSRAKGVPWLLSAFEAINTQTYHLHMVGDGSGKEKDECLKLAKKLGNNVQLYGNIDQQKLSELLKAANIFVLPSLYEGLPLVILEALACGCRIVTTNLPGCLEIKNNTTPGFITLVPLPRLHSIDKPYPDDEGLFIDNLRSAIQRCIKTCKQSPNPAPDTISKNVSQYTWKHIFERVEKKYFQLI